MKNIILLITLLFFTACGTTQLIIKSDGADIAVSKNKSDPIIFKNSAIIKDSFLPSSYIIKISKDGFVPQIIEADSLPCGELDINLISIKSVALNQDAINSFLQENEDYRIRQLMFNKKYLEAKRIIKRNPTNPKYKKYLEIINQIDINIKE